MEETVLKTGAVLIVLIAVLGGLVYVASSRLQLVPANLADVDAIAFESCGLGTPDFRGAGLLPEYGARQYGEVYDRTRVWYAWFKDGTSQAITGAGGIVKCSGALVTSPPDWGQYEFQINNGDGFKPFHQDQVPKGVWAFTGDPAWLQGDRLRFPPFSLHIDGFAFCTVDTTSGCPSGKEENIVDGAALRVLVRAGRLGGLNPWDARVFVQDEVELRSAIPRVSWGAAAYLIGSTALVRYEIPVATDENGNPAYFLSVLDENTHLPLPGFDRRPLATTSGSFGIPVTPDLFSNVLATCQNRLRAQVLSQLIVADLQDTAVQAPVAIGGVPPAVTSVALDKAEYFEGETATVTWTATGNVTKFHVTAHTSGLITFDDDLPSSARTVSFSVPRTGVLQVEVTAYSGCQPSTIARRYATIGNVYPGLCTAYPDLPQCSVTNVLAWVLAALAVLAILATFGAALWLLGKLEVVPPWVSVLVAIAAAGALAASFLSSGVFDVVLLGG